MNTIPTTLDLLATWMVELDALLRIRTVRQPVSGSAEMPFISELPIGVPLVQAMGLCTDDAVDLVRRLRAGEGVKSYPYALDHELLGLRRYVLSVVPIYGSQGKPKGYYCSISDLTATLDLASRHDRNEAELSAILDASPTFLTVTDLEGRFIRLNATARRIIAQWCDAPIGLTSREIFPAALAADLEVEDARVLETERAAEFEQQFLIGGQLRDYLTLKFPIFDRDGCIIGIGATGMDITERKRMVAELDRLANYDVLTEIPNRRLCQKRLDEAIVLAEHTDDRVATILVDINDFRTLNSTFGQDGGDQILIEAAWRLKSAVPVSATVARLSADEFCILVTSFDQRDQVRATVDLIHAAFEDPMIVSGREVFVRVTTGAAIYPVDADGFDQLMCKADMALQHAKRQSCPAGYFATGMDQAARQRAHTAHLLRRAIARKELRIAYQPIVDSATGLPVVLEALLRWECAELGNVAPDIFISIAEETGMILDIGSWVLKTACADAVTWNAGRAQPVGVAINVSPRQLLSPDFAGQVRDTLEETGLHPPLLKIEITESCLAADIVVCKQVLDNLAAQGIVLALDDFGTGYSALSYLQNFKFHILKLDQSFVRKIVPGESSAALTASIIAMAKSLGMRTVAEGVEHAEHQNILRFQGCDYLQGYYFDRPGPWQSLGCLHEMARAA